MFLRKAGENHEPDENQGNEELYEKLFTKIGRDFVYKEDFYRVMRAVLFLIDNTGLFWPDFKSDAKATAKAREYMKVLDEGKDGTKIYKDLINLDE